MQVSNWREKMKRLIRMILFLISSTAILFSCTIITISIILYKYKDSKITPALLNISSKNDSTTFYGYDFSDRQSRIGNAVLLDGEEINNGTEYEYVPYNIIPQQLIHAFVAIEDKRFDVIICNFANVDMVGHTGIMDAALKAVEAVDICLGKVEQAIKNVGGVLIVTADHGNAEKMVDEKTGQPYTAHTVGKVQAVLVNDQSGVKELDNGCLADIAPTMLDLLNIKQPAEMTGKSLLKR